MLRRKASRRKAKISIYFSFGQIWSRNSFFSILSQDRISRNVRSTIFPFNSVAFYGDLLNVLHFFTVITIIHWNY